MPELPSRKGNPDSQNIAKGVVIFLAVMMHVVTVHETPVWRVAISSFHVPLFFIVSGLVIGRAKDGWRAYVRKNALILLLPYFIWAVIFTPFKLEFLPWILYGNLAALTRIGTNTALWFLPALFCARLMYEGAMRLLERVPAPRVTVVLAAAALAFAVGWVLPRPEMGYPFGINVGLLALGYILIGSVIRDCLLAAERQGRAVLSTVAVVAAALFVYGAFLRPGEHNLVGMAELRFGSPFWFFWNALFGSTAVLSAAVALAKIPEGKGVPGAVRCFMVWLGCNALGVFLTHMPVCRRLVAPCFEACGLDRASWYGALLIAVVTTALCSGLIYLVGRFLPKLLVWLGIRREAL